MASVQADNSTSSTTPILSQKDIPLILKKSVPKGVFMPLPVKYTIDGVEVEIGLKWYQERNHEAQYQVEAYARRVLVGVRGGPVNDKGKAIKELFSLKWWNKALAPDFLVAISQSMRKMAVNITPQTAQEECYVCMTTIEDGTEIDCRHPICTRCFFKCVKHDREMNSPSFQCGMCRKRYDYTGEWTVDFRE